MRDMISVASGFQYSVNIGYDLGSDNKLKSFIPTKSALSLLEDILLSVNPTSSDRARVLIGAYGKGKSHIVLTILSILMKRDLTLFEKLMPKIEENPRLYQLIQNYYESENKILPVVISGSNTSLTQAFLLSLQRTLSEHDLLSAMPETNYTYAMELFFKTGHVATLKPEFINHSPEQFAYFDNRTDVSLTREQRSLFKAFNNVSRLFSVNRCVFFSINLLTSKVNRSQAAHDIHTMIHPVVEADGTICLFCHDDEVMLSFLGFGLRCILSDWYPMADENETLLEKLDIANFSIVRGTDYFSDMIYLLARNYYQSGQPSTYELIPIDFISRAGVDEIDREALNQYVQDQLNAPLYEYGDDYVEYDESAQIQNTDIGADLDLMLLEMDDEDDNPFGEDIEPEDDLDDDDEFFDEDAESENKDEYEFDDIDPEIFRDPLLMVKWLNRHTQNQS